jgi:RimJ/RimL family protein N-acetyltransferase
VPRSTTTTAFIPLVTERLVLRQLTPEDTSALARILGDPDVMRHSVGGVLSENATREFIEWCRLSYREHGFGPWAVVEQSTSLLAGFCGLNAERVEDADEIELGYRLAPGFWGKGLGTEAARSALAYGFDTLHLPGVIAIVEPANAASVRVIKKLGFGGYIHSQYHRRGVRIYRMTAGQWTLPG